MTGFGIESKRLGASALVYLLPNLLVRGGAFLLTPLYAWTMSTGDFAAIGVANTIAGFLGMLLGLAVHGSVTRIHFELVDERERKRFYGTLMTFLATGPVVVALLLEWLGNLGWLDWFHSVRFHPHLELALWAALLGIYSGVPSAMFVAREEAPKAAAFNLVAGAAQLAFNLFFVLGLREGAVGVLRASVASAGVTAAMSFWVMRRHAMIGIDGARLRTALLFSLPLVPHLLSNWALSVSDRLVLDQYVSSTQLALYSLAYYFNFGVGLFANSTTAALAPIATRLLKANPRGGDDLPRLGVAALVAMVAAGAAVVTLAPEAIALLAPPRYHAAVPLVPWLVLGAVFQGVYLINSIGTLFSMRTLGIPLVTGATAVLNIGLNVALVPRIGILAAALSTAIAYGASALAHGWLAHQLHPIRWGYWRWLRAIACGCACAAASYLLPDHPPWVSIPLKGALLVLGLPATFVTARVFTLHQLGMAVRSARGGVGRLFAARTPAGDA